MAILNTDTAQSQTDGLAKAGNLVKDGSVVCGNVLHAHGVHTIDSAVDATSDTIRIVKVKADCWILPELCSVVHEAGGTAYTVTVGDETDADRFSTALDLSSAGTTAFSGGVESLTPVKVTAGTWITATATSVTTPTDTNTFKFNVAYKGIS